MSENYLVWKFEAFREYLSYKVVRNASQVLSLYEGEDFNIKNYKILEMQDLLMSRTNKYTWIPNRKGSDFLNINLEGDIYRNKGRLLTSLMVIYPKELSDFKIKLTDFGYQLANGYITEKSYYEFIICNFKYPHPAYDDDWLLWKSKGIVLLPFIMILDVLQNLSKNDKDNGYLETEEIAYFIYANPNHENIPYYCRDIIESRAKGIAVKVEKSDKIHRKINDILGFLVLSKKISKKGNRFWLTNSDELSLLNLSALVDSSYDKYLRDNK